MSNTPEAKIKRRITDALKRHGVYYFYPVTGGYGHSGLPDLVCCMDGAFVGIEVKAGTKTPTALQQAELDKIKAAGGIAMAVNEGNIDKFLIWLEISTQKGNEDDSSQSTVHP